VAGVEKALLKYCELDTLAMVMLWEEWQQQIQSGKPGGLIKPGESIEKSKPKALPKNRLKKVLKST